MYERQINANTVLTMEADYDVKDINQTFSQISDNVNPNYKHYADLRHDGRFLGYAAAELRRISLPTRWSRKGRRFKTWHDGFGTRGTLIQNSRGTIRNIGGRFREELEFVPKVDPSPPDSDSNSRMVSVQTINYNNGAVPARKARSGRISTTGRRKCR